MSKTYMRLSVGGVERGMKFNMGTLKYLKDVTGGDPFAFFLGTDIDDQIRQVAAIVYAALMSNCRIKKEDPDFKYEDVILWTEDMSPSDAKIVVDAFREAFGAGPSGEEGTDTQGRAAVVAAGDGDSAWGAGAESARVL